MNLLLSELKRQFQSLYPYVIDTLIKENDICSNFAQDRLKNMIEKTMLNRNYYSIFPISLAYNLMETNKSEDNIFLAIILDWITELFISSYFLLDDMIDNSETRWKQLCSYTTAPKTTLYNSKLMRCSGYSLLKKYFFNKPYYKSLVQLIQQSTIMTVLGQCLDINKCFLTNEKNGANYYSMKMFEYFAEQKTYFFYCRFSVYAAMYLADKEMNHELVQIDNVFKKLAHIQQAQNDIWDLYGSEKVMGKRGNDISQGKFTWLIAKAQELSSTTQLETIKNNYGKEDLECCKNVELIYDQLNLLTEYFNYKRKYIDDINSKISKIEDKGIVKVLYTCLEFFEIGDLIILQHKYS
ncbi:hypothetical protein FQR65_LT13966 [Abscondita terminalis]|nr:hypothetical protein FQR65_LT13966 [Abscondita terminalis]